MQSELKVYVVVVNQSNATAEVKNALKTAVTSLGIGQDVSCPNSCSSNGQCTPVGCLCNASFGKSDCSIQLSALAAPKSASSMLATGFVAYFALLALLV